MNTEQCLVFARGNYVYSEITVGLLLDENAKGIPDFWLTIFKNVEMLSEMVQVSMLQVQVFLLT